MLFFKERHSADDEDDEFVTDKEEDFTNKEDETDTHHNKFNNLIVDSTLTNLEQELSVIVDCSCVTIVFTKLN